MRGDRCVAAVSCANANLNAGEAGLGKSTLVNTLFNTPLYQPKEPLAPSAERPKTVAIESITAGTPPSLLGGSAQFFFSRVLVRADIEENNVRLRLTVVDTPGFGDFVDNDERSVRSPVSPGRVTPLSPLSLTLSSPSFPALL